MGYETPRLDDRAFADIMAEALQRIPLYTPEWTDHNLSDPGITVIELFAWMTDIILYRLNRVPDKHFIKFIELIGMKLREAEPARAPVTFWLTAPQAVHITIPMGTEVATTRTETDPAITFSTDIESIIRVPKLKYVMTRSGTTGQVDTYNVKDLASGKRSLKIFPSTPPVTGDVVFFGFEEDLSHHILGFEMDVEEARGAGVDPTDPPYIWEAMGREEDTTWTKVEIDEDTTDAFNNDGVMTLHLPAMQEGERNDLTAYWVRCRLDPREDMFGYQVSPEIHQLTAASWGITVETTNVMGIKNESLGRSDGTPGQRFYTQHTPIAPRLPGEQLLVRLEDGVEERWVEVSDFANSGPDDKHYTLDSQTGELRVGPALPQRDGSIWRYGSIVPRNAQLIFRAYRYGGGIEGNVAASTLNVLKSSLPFMERVANRRAAQGGLNAEDLEDAKVRVPGYLRTLQRAVTAEDFEYLAREAAPGAVGRVYCLQPPQTQAGEVRVLVIPQIPNMQGYIAPESLILPEPTRERIMNFLDERRLISTDLEVSPPNYHWVQTEVRFHASAFFDGDEVRGRVRDKLFDFLNPLTGGNDGAGWPFGRDLFVSDIMAALLTVPGVDFIRSVRLYPVAENDGEFSRGNEVESIALTAQGVVVSHEHDVIEE